MFDKVDPNIIAAFKAAFRDTGRRGEVAVQKRGASFIAKAVEMPLRQGIMSGDNGIMDIFQSIPFEHGTMYQYPIDWLAPGTENDFTAWVIPREGDLPTNQIEGDFVAIPTYEVGNAISWRISYARDAGFEILGRAMEVLEAGFMKKRNDDGWRVVIAAGYDRNIVVFDSNASQGEFTKRAVSLAKVTMRRNAGGNAGSLQPRALTDIYLSPEMIEGMRNWGLDEVDEVTRREIYLADDGGERLSRVFGVNLHDTFELGEGQEYQQYYTDLGGSLASGDVELMVGINQRNSNSFIHPVREQVRIFPDERLDYYRLAGLYGMAEYGFASLDGRDTLLLSC